MRRKAHLVQKTGDEDDGDNLARRCPIPFSVCLLPFFVFSGSSHSLSILVLFLFLVPSLSVFFFFFPLFSVMFFFSSCVCSFSLRFSPVFCPCSCVCVLVLCLVLCCLPPWFPSVWVLYVRSSLCSFSPFLVHGLSLAFIKPENAMRSPPSNEVTHRCYCRSNASWGSWQAWFMNEEGDEQFSLKLSQFHLKWIFPICPLNF